VFKVIWTKVRIAVLSPLMAANAFICYVRWAGTLASNGRQTMQNALMHMYATMGWHISQQWQANNAE